MSINISDYNRNGVYIEEKTTLIENTVQTNEIINFIPGFSRKGTVFNKPILIQNKNQRLTKFGDIDRLLEKKGSYFHRTIDVALQSAPVYAMNLLKTNSLDTLNYVSMSLSAQYDNDIVKEQLYDDFFDKSGFWQRDTESFLYFAKDPEKMIHFTNVSDKKITFFMFKTTLPGYDVTAEVWYGGKNNVPTWIRPESIMNDFLVRLVVLSGDWSNYITLSVDSNWSKYFNTSGLRKDKLDSFINDKNVSVLADYKGSVIPYFKDNNGRGLFIETLVNIDTDVTGLFCSFDIDAVETDYPNGNIDLIGETLVGLDKSKINFMSYNDTIEEIDSYESKLLDTSNNVLGLGTISSRTVSYANNTLVNLTNATFTLPTTANPVLTLSALGTTNSSPKCIINGTDLLLTGSNVITFDSISTVPSTGDMTYRIDMVYIDPTTGEITLLSGTEFNDVESLTESVVVSNGLTYPSNYPNGSIILGYLFRTLDDSSVYNATYVPVSLKIGVGNSFNQLTMGVGSSYDISIVAPTVNNITLTFENTSNVTKADYKAYRSSLFFTELSSKFNVSNSVIIDNNADKVKFSMSVNNIGDKSLTLLTDSADIKTQSLLGNFIVYYNDNEFIMDVDGLSSSKSEFSGSGVGIASINSEFYSDYVNGMINTGDYFYEKLAILDDFKFNKYINLNYTNSIGNYIILSSTDANTLGLSVGANNMKLLIKTNLNDNVFTVNTGYAYNSTPTTGSVIEGLVNDGVLSSGEIAFLIQEEVINETITENTNIYDYNLKVYLKIYLLSSLLKVDFMSDRELMTPYSINNLSLNQDINVYSGEASYTQTLEIETHPSYIQTPNKILVDSVRYSEIKVGDYIKAYVDTNELEPGEYPKKFARILKKSPWSENSANNVQYVELTTDIKIDITDFNGDLQTTRYTNIDNYIDTYKGNVLKGFTVQSTSIPNGTETRLSEILDIIGKDTSLYNAIVDKNKFNFRYLIDSFGLGLTEYSKQQLADITGKRKNCLAFINAPSAKSFKQSSSPYFINTNGTLNLDYVRQGGNPDQNPAFLYTFAQGSGLEEGQSTSAYFFPYVNINDNGRPLSFPPSAFIANTYMRKNNSSIAGKYNHTVAAGVEDGIILGISNVEMAFTDDDLVAMNTMGLNPILYAKNTGYYIGSEYTASVTPKSPLSYIHSREVLIDLENEIYAMLFKYQYKFNIAPIRAKIKRQADAICQKYLDRSAIVYYDNVIDESNNTAELIDNQFGLLETTIIIVSSMATIVNQINITTNGALASSTGFN